ncbi:MAG: hypothetical protein DCF15_07950 [Phormidesmis priestleyi]|uniref:Putative restriction endonuclease domain-containing protein n=1 Tax=Phormidesmis priestleyi TaxID=268141 RepID=A0A2W4ZPP8_9CYAN|nr:MAG: hypothetical protein DCF15_07950 [Phormidesmis priestleyi]
MVQAPARPLTLDAFLALPETKPASEFIDGKMIAKPMPQGKHSTIQRDLTMAVEMALKPERIGRAFPELRCSFGGRSVVPDISVFISQHIPRNADGTIANQFTTSPDWVIEILSPAQSQTKVTKNILYCLKHGTQLGWLIDPDEQTIFIHSLECPLRVFDMESQDESKPLPVPRFANSVTLTTKSIMNWLLD